MSSLSLGLLTEHYTIRRKPSIIRVMFKKFQGLYVLFVFFGCLMMGTLGYRLIEGWPWLDSLYMTVITITTVGFHEENPLSPEGKVFTIFLIFIGFGIGIYFISNLTQLILRGELFAWVRRYLMSAKVELFDDHFILCGYGRMGKVVAKQLELKKIPFVIIENNPHKAPTINETIHPVIVGSSGDEKILQQAAIEKARGVISVVSSDAENAFTVMTARRMNPELHIVSRCFQPSNIPKLKLSGADQVISPFELSGNRITQAALHPTMVEFVDFLENVTDESIEMADIQIVAHSKLVGKKLSDPMVADLGIIVVGVKKKSKEFMFNPRGDMTIESEDHLVIVGPQNKVDSTATLSE